MFTRRETGFNVGWMYQDDANRRPQHSWDSLWRTTESDFHLLSVCPSVFLCPIHYHLIVLLVVSKVYRIELTFSPQVTSLNWMCQISQTSSPFYCVKEKHCSSQWLLPAAGSENVPFFTELNSREKVWTTFCVVLSFCFESCCCFRASKARTTKLFRSMIEHPLDKRTSKNVRKERESHTKPDPEFLSAIVCDLVLVLVTW